MELTLDQALQKGIEAHKAGKIPENLPRHLSGVYNPDSIKRKEQKKIKKRKKKKK